MKTAVSICNTPMQVINTINLMVNHFPDCEFDLVITTQIRDYKALYESALNGGVFRNVYLVDTKTVLSVPKRYFLTVSKSGTQKKIRKLNPKMRFDYNHFFFNNADDAFVNAFCYAQKNLEHIGWFEEGLSSYCVQGYFWEKGKRNKINLFLKKMFHLCYLCESIDVQYLYKPELAGFEVPFKRKRLKSLLVNRDKITELSNRTFNFKKDDLFSRKYLYFEESYRADGFEVNDVEIISRLVDAVGNDNLTVKIHPRSDAGLFRNYNLNSATQFPWELYLLNNEKFDNCLVSISSGCILSPFMLFGIREKVVCLLNLLDKTKLPQEKIEYLDFFRSQILEKNPDIFLMPDDLSELRLLLQ